MAGPLTFIQVLSRIGLCVCWLNPWFSSGPSEFKQALALSFNLSYEQLFMIIVWCILASPKIIMSLLCPDVGKNIGAKGSTDAWRVLLSPKSASNE
eukprot:6291046-Amphidinium_carterae.1